MLVGGYRSRIDDSVQPFGIVLPAGFQAENSKPHRVDVWLHGRGDTKTEIAFLTERRNKAGQYTPAETVVLHPFGRHCNAFKFAGETDVYESISHLEALLPVDHQKLAIRGFSMGGAGCWHFAVHDPGNWFAANPGAGFVDTIVYQRWQGKMPYRLSETRSKLMKWYDVLPWVGNLQNTRTVAYSGEIDKQKQAADRVVAQADKLGMKIDYVIGEGMGHKIDPKSGERIEKIIDQWAGAIVEPPRERIDFTTYTLRYHQVDWLSVTGLVEHWNAGKVRAEIKGPTDIEITTDGVTRLKLDFRESGWPGSRRNANVTIDGEKLLAEDWGEASGLQIEFEKKGQWRVVEVIDSGRRKRPGMQGPIDDAFCDRFLFVAPTRPASHGVVQRWIDQEFTYAKDRWRELMRGDIRVTNDNEVTAEDIESNHLICFGDFSSNQYLRSIAPQLPIKWTRQQLTLGSREFDPAIHAAVFCFPNPKNPSKYVVVNSGMTFREFSNVSNSRQIAMLPDWAVLNVSEKSDGIFPATVVSDGFFDEKWELRP